MSVEQANAFIEKLDTDKTFLTQVAGAGSDEARLELAQKAGFEFTTEEFATAMGESASDELSEDDLESVAGGFTVESKGGWGFTSSWKVLSSKYTEVEWTY